MASTLSIIHQRDIDISGDPLIRHRRVSPAYRTEGPTGDDCPAIIARQIDWPGTIESLRSISDDDLFRYGEGLLSGSSADILSVTRVRNDDLSPAIIVQYAIAAEAK